jgi:hypothetical protein
MRESFFQLLFQVDFGKIQLKNQQSGKGSDRKKPKRCGIDAIAQPGGLGTVIKKMPQMGVTVFAANLGTYHEQAPVALPNDIFRRQGPCKTGPARTRFKLVL